MEPRGQPLGVPKIAQKRSWMSVAGVVMKENRPYEAASIFD